MQDFRLIMKQGPIVGKHFDLTKDVVTLGRDLSNDIIINDAEMSRHHSRLVRQGASYAIEDLGSTNGTFVNSARTTGQVLLKTGDQINFGDTVSMVFEIPGGEPATLINNAVGLSTDAPRPANVASYTPPPADPAPDAPTRQAAPNNTKLFVGIGVGCLVLFCCLLVVGVAVFWATNNLR